MNTKLNELLESDSELVSHENEDDNIWFYTNRDLLRAVLPILKDVNKDEDGDEKFIYTKTFISYLEQLI